MVYKKLKFYQLIFILVLFVLSCFFPKASSASNNQTILSLSQQAQSIKAGDIFSVNLNIQNVENLFAFQASISYDSSFLEYQDGTEGGFLNKNGTETTLKMNPRLSPGLIMGYAVSKVGQASGVSGSDVLAIFRFKALKSGAAQLFISTDENRGTKLMTSFLNTIPYQAENLSLQISSGDLVQFNSQDKTSPFIKNIYPLNNALNVSAKTSITIGVGDNESGVNPNSILLEINKKTVKPQISNKGGYYEVYYKPDQPFSFGEMVEISVSASDMASPANIMPKMYFSFFVEQGPAEKLDSSSQTQVLPQNQINPLLSANVSDFLSGIQTQTSNAQNNNIGKDALVLLLKGQITSIKNLLAQLQAQFQQINKSQKSYLTGFFKYGDKGNEVKLLQQWLAKDKTIYPEDIVSGFFGQLTKKAVEKFQIKYKAEILSPLNLSTSTGIVGLLTRNKLNLLYGEY